MFDPWILKLAEVMPKELIWVEYYAYDAVFIQLESLMIFKAIIYLNSTDIGNCFVTVLLLILSRIKYYDVNSIKTNWKERDVSSWAYLLQFTSFHISGSTTKTNNINTAIAIVAVFLVSRSDRSHPKLCSSD